MTNRRALELLMIENACVRRGSECDRDCGKCELVQDTNELLEMYSFVIRKMIPEVEEEQRYDKWRDWQRNCDPHADLVI